MGLWNWLRGGKRSVLDHSAEELKREERILEREKKALMNKMSRLAREKQDIFEKGVGKKSPELRRALAQDYEMKTAEEQMAARQLNIKGKELLTVARVKMIREAQGSRTSSRILTGLSERDMLELQRLITADDVSREMYEDKLDEILTGSLGEARTAEPLSGAGRKLMEVWQQLDEGDLADPQQAFEKAEAGIRKELQKPDEEF